MIYHNDEFDELDSSEYSAVNSQWSSEESLKNWSKTKIFKEFDTS